MRPELKLALAAAALAGASAVVSAPVSAATLITLSGDDTLTRIDLETRTVIGRTHAAGSARLFSIDVRPSTGQLYGLFIVKGDPGEGDRGAVSSVDPVTGGRSNTVVVDYPFIRQIRYNIDFDPTSDRLRIVSENDEHFEVDVETGEAAERERISGPSPVCCFGRSSSVVSIAFANATTSAIASLLYGIDRKTDTLYTIVPALSPTSGNISKAGLIDRNLTQFGFDIGLDGSGRNRGRIVADGQLVEIDLAGGSVVSTSRIKGLTPSVNMTTRDLTTLSGAAD